MIRKHKSPGLPALVSGTSNVLPDSGRRGGGGLLSLRVYFIVFDVSSIAELGVTISGVSTSNSSKWAIRALLLVERRCWRRMMVKEKVFCFILRQTYTVILVCTAVCHSTVIVALTHAADVCRLGWLGNRKKNNE